MKKSTALLSILILVLLGLGVYLLKPAAPTEPSAPFPQPVVISHKEDPSRPSTPLTPAEASVAKSSLKQMTHLLASFTVQEKTLDELIASLKKDQQEPVQIRDKNPDTGEMIIVRTKSPPPGTRYFHAQYFIDDNKQAFAQHMSFEFRPSPEAMEQAIQMVRETFADLGAPTEESRDFIQWELPHAYVVWVKRLDQQDITNNPFNAYTPGDIGSIRIAIELNPEGHGH